MMSSSGCLNCILLPLKTKIIQLEVSVQEYSYVADLAVKIRSRRIWLEELALKGAFYHTLNDKARDDLTSRDDP